MKEIKNINQEFESEIEELTELKEKYERKKMVNSENKDALEQEKQNLEEKEQEVKSKISEHEATIEGFTELTHDMKLRIKKKEKFMQKRNNLTKEYENRQQEYRELIQNISQ